MTKTLNFKLLPIIVLLLSASAFFFAASVLALPNKTLEVNEVELQRSNPSLGPYEKKVTFTLSATTFPKEVEKLLDHSKVNASVTLREYLLLMQQADYPAIKAVDAKFQATPLAQGSMIERLSFTLVGGQVLEINDLRTLQISGDFYEHFLNFLIQRGTRQESGPIGVPTPDPPIRVFPPSPLPVETPR